MDNGASSYRRFLDGDESAFDEIIRELFDKLTAFVNRYVNDEDAAEDIAIDVFSDLVVHRHRYNFKTALKTYLFTVGRSRALNYIKRRKRTECLELNPDITPSDDTAAPERVIIASENRAALYAALKKLPADMQDAVSLVYFEEMSYDDAAKIMKKSRKQIDNILYRAKKQLRILLDKEDDMLL